MGKSKNKKLSFLEKLAKKLEESNLGTVECDSFDDESASWVTLKIGDTTLSIDFDYKGEKINKIGLYKDKIEIVGEEMIWGK